MVMQRRSEANHVALPNATRPGLHWKPLDAAIGRLLTPYRPDGRHGDNQQNNHVKRTLFAGRFYGHHDATVLHRAHHLMEKVRGFHKSH
jgi:hypothetical protein